MTYYIINEALRKQAETLVEGAKKATGYDGETEVAILDPNVNWGSNSNSTLTSSVYPAITTTYPQTISGLGGSTGSNTINFPTASSYYNYPANTRSEEHTSELQ